MGSHTATGEWQSFELRMRHRRAERLVLRAEAAAEAGFVEEARACLDEARRLAPGVYGIAAIEDKLDIPPLPTSSVVPVAEPEPGVGSAHPARHLRRVALTAGVPAAAAVALAIFAAQRPSTVVPAQDFRAMSEAPPVPVPVPVPAVVAAPALSDPVKAATPQLEAPQLEAPSSEAADTRAGAAGETPDNFIAPLPAPRPLPASLSQALPVTELPPTESPSAPVNASLNTDVAVQTGLPETAPGASLPAPAAAAATGDSRAGELIRGVLDRYAAAYSALDASAAERVWPGVNAAALARAFDALASQEVSLGDCRVDVRGATARAQCAGSTRWTPKIGDQSAHTEPRQWTFDLSRAGDGWQIVGARVQNR